MKKPKQKHNEERTEREELELLFHRFTLYTARLVKHPHLDHRVRKQLFDLVNNLCEITNNHREGWAAEVQARLPVAFRFAQEEKERTYND